MDKGAVVSAMIRFGRFLLCGALAIFISVAAQAETGGGTTTGSFLKLGVGARGVAMGNTQTAAVDDATALYWNPAALDKLPQAEVNLMHNQYFLGVTHDVLNYAQPTTALGTIGVGVSYVKVDDVTGYGKTGTKTGDLAVTDTLVTLGWGKKWETLQMPAFYTGMNVKYLRKELGNYTGTAMLADLGFSYTVQGRWLHGLQTGLVMQNLSNGIQFISQKEKLPEMMKIGVAYPILGNSLVLAGDYVAPKGESANFNVGMDYKVWDILALRLGYKGQEAFGSGLAYGLGISRGALRLDYAFVPQGDLGSTHRMSIGYRFGAKRTDDGVEAQVEKAYASALTSYAQGRLVDAYMQAGQVTEVAPWHRASRSLMEKVQGDLKELEGVARKNEFEGQIEKHYERGVAHFEKDEMIQAKREFEVILTLMPDHDGAKSYLARIGERFRNMGANFFEMGMKQFSEGQYQDAKESYQKVLVMDPSHPQAGEMIAKTDALLQAAKSQQEAKDREEAARKLFQTAMAQMQAKQYEEASRTLDQVLSDAPEFQEAKRYRGMVRNMLAKGAFDAGMKAMQAGNWREAMSGFRRAVELKPDYTEAQGLLEKLQAKQGEQRKSESIQLYKQGLETLLAGDKEKTRELWQKAADLWPDNLDAKRGLERLSSGRGNGRRG